MAQSRTVWVNGAVSVSPTPVMCGPTLSDNLTISLTNTFQASKSSPLSFVGTDGSPYTVSLDSIVKVRFLALKVNSGATVKMLLTSAAGSEQKLSVSGMFLWHAPNAGDEITAIKLVGTADVELLLAGDLS
jgi:hypothetical protein